MKRFLRIFFPKDRYTYSDPKQDRQDVFIRLIMIITNIVLLAGFLVFQFTVDKDPYQDKFKVQETEHFILLYTDQDEDTLKDIADILEKGYPKVIEDLKPENITKTRIKIYPNLEDFHQAIKRPDAPSWVMAEAFGKNEVRIVSPKNPGPQNDYQSALKAALRGFVRCVEAHIARPSPRTEWLWESVALYEAGQFEDPKKLDYLKAGQYPTIKELNNPDSPKIYDVGYTISEYIADKWGMSTLRELVEAYGAIPIVLQMETEEFEKGWREYVKEKYLKP